MFCDTASAKKPPTPKNEKGKRKKAKAAIIRALFKFCVAAV